MMMNNNMYQTIIMQFLNLKSQIEFLGFQLQNSMISNFEFIMNGIGVINIGIQIMKINLENNMNSQILNITLQIQNLGLQLQNFGYKIQNYGMINADMGMQIQNQKMMNIKTLDINKSKDKIQNVVFQTGGIKNILTFPYGTTMKKVLEAYLIRRPEIKNKNNLKFIYNMQIININDETKVEDFFNYSEMPKISVIYDDLIGG